MNVALIAANDVLCDTSWKVNEQGRMLLAALAEKFKVVVGLDDQDIERFTMWAQMQGVKGFQEILPGRLPLAMRGGDQRLAQIDVLKGRGDAVIFLVDNNPDRIAAAMEVGVHGLLFAHAKFMRPEFRPDFVEKPRPWDDLVAEIHHQAYLESTLGE